MDGPLKIKGIVVRASSYGDNDKMLSVLSEELGVISICAKGVKSLKNKNSAASDPLCYSEMVIKASGELYSLVSADVIESFYPLREDMTALSGGVYFAQLAAMCVGEGVSAKEELRLLLNTLYILSKYPARCAILRPVFELRLCEVVGVAPIVGACSCGNESEYFDIEDGESVCAFHKKPSSKKISKASLRVVEYILESSLKEALLFDTPLIIAHEICDITEAFMTFQFGNLPKSLDYLKKVSQ